MKRPACGFTLVEVMVALAVVAITLAAAMRAVAVLGDNASRLAQVRQAQWCIDNELVGLKLAQAWPDVGDARFDCEQLGRRYEGRTRTRPTPNPNFRRVDAEVLDAQGVVLLSVATVVGRR